MFNLRQANKLDHVQGSFLQGWSLFRQDAPYHKKRMGQSIEIWDADIYDR